MEWENERYAFGDSELKKLLIQENKKIELSKFKYKLKIAKIVNEQMAKSKNVVIQPEDIQDVTEKLFDEMNTLNKKAFLLIAQNAYSRAYDECKEFVEKPKKKKYVSKSQLEDMLNFFLLNLGFTYYSVMKRQEENFNNYISKVMNEKINKALRSKTEDDINKNYRKILTDAVSLSGVEVLKVFKRLKKSYSNAIDNIMVSIVNTTRSNVFEYLGIEFVQRVSQKDSKVCSVCEPLDGKIYRLDKAPDVESHYFCRCYYIPYLKKERINAK